jgi:ABC-2 type transport system ATP-binding protein
LNGDMNNGAPAAAIAARSLTKRFGNVLAVDAAEFDVREGEVFGFLGPNGAGKTTTINMLTGLARPTAGSLHIFGRDVTANVKRAQHLMGIVPDESNLYPELDGFENLCFCASLYGVRRREREVRATKLLEQFALADVAHRRFAAYSKGMKRKLTIAAGIIHRPRILFLDEPTTGIDVASARQIRQMLAELNRAGTTIFLTTHYIEEAERLCQRIAFLVAGRLIRVDSLANLIRDVQDKHIVQLSASGGLANLAAPLHEAFSQDGLEHVSDSLLRVHTDRPLPLAPLIRFLEEHGVQVTEARVVRPSLEDVFVRITGIELQRMKQESGG